MMVIIHSTPQLRAHKEQEKMGELVQLMRKSPTKRWASKYDLDEHLGFVGNGTYT